jgi:acylphosphatase
MEHIAFRIHGDVQGVGYRRFAAHVAQELGLAGWVRNGSGGTVCGEAEGPVASMIAFRARLAQGPPFAHVSRLDWEDLDMRSSLPLPFEIHR